jgi:hypothetical protein
MLSFFRSSKTEVLTDLDAFWAYLRRTQPTLETPDGPAADAEERLDLALGSALKTLLEHRIGPEEGENPVQWQNWDWNDDRTRPVYVVRSAFKPAVIQEIQALLKDDFADSRVLLLFQDSREGDIWGGAVITSDRLVVQRAVVHAFTAAA